MAAWIPTIEAQAEGQLLQMGRLAREHEEEDALKVIRLHHRARACVGGRSKRGQEGQALGRSRGGFTTKIHAKSDASGDIIAFD